MTHLAIITGLLLIFAYVGLVALDVVMCLFEQSRVFGGLALIGVAFAARVLARYLL